MKGKKGKWVTAVDEEEGEKARDCTAVAGVKERAQKNLRRSYRGKKGEGQHAAGESC